MYDNIVVICYRAISTGTRIFHLKQKTANLITRSREGFGNVDLFCEINCLTSSLIGMIVPCEGSDGSIG
jgi:hypothetical protein